LLYSVAILAPTFCGVSVYDLDGAQDKGEEGTVDQELMMHGMRQHETNQPAVKGVSAPTLLHDLMVCSVIPIFVLETNCAAVVEAPLVSVLGKRTLERRSTRLVKHRSWKAEKPQEPKVSHLISINIANTNSHM
jgi:hypothetical protein